MKGYLIDLDVAIVSYGENIHPMEAADHEAIRRLDEYLEGTFDKLYVDIREKYGYPVWSFRDTHLKEDPTRQNALRDRLNELSGEYPELTFVLRTYSVFYGYISCRYFRKEKVMDVEYCLEIPEKEEWKSYEK